MSMPLRQQNRCAEIRCLDGAPVQTILRQPGQTAQLWNGIQTFDAGCLGCVNRPCMTYASEELQFAAVPDFPYSPEEAVCPVAAISWNHSENYPVIDAKRCIVCGLCAARCPVSAIYFQEGFHISKKTKGILRLPDTPEHRACQQQQLAALHRADTTGTWFLQCDAQIQNLYQALSKKRYDPQLPNHLVRNCLLELGYHCAIRRRGDVNLRMDALFSKMDQIGVAEIEFHQDALEPPRAVLDDIAVLYARYGVDKQTILPLIVHLELPSVRTGHWQVVEDIQSVLGLRIHTVTLGALLLLLWHGKQPDLQHETSFLRMESRSLRGFLAEHGVTTTLPVGCCSILEPEK